MTPLRGLMIACKTISIEMALLRNWTKNQKLRRSEMLIAPKGRNINK